MESNINSIALNIDCMEYMRTVPDKFFDLAIVDPQTGQDEGKKHTTRGGAVKQKNGSIISVKQRHVAKDWDSKPPTSEYYSELLRVCKSVIIMCENRLSFPQKQESAGRIVWNLLRKNDFGDCQIMWTNLFQKVEYFEYMWNGMMQGIAIDSRIQQGNKQLNENRIHPSQKPVIVYKKLLQNYAKPGDKILDTHLGSGSSRIAAYEMGFDFTGCELDTDYFNAQEKRFKEHISKAKLFTPQQLAPTQSKLQL